MNQAAKNHRDRQNQNREQERQERFARFMEVVTAKALLRERKCIGDEHDRQMNHESKHGRKGEE